MIKIDLGTGPLEQFQFEGDPTTQASRWRTWKQSIQILITAKGVTDPKQKEAILLHVGGMRLQEVYFTLPDLTQDGWADLDAYEKAVKKLDAYFAPKVNEAYERHKFRKLKQQQGESVAHFVSKLRVQSDLCNFTNTAEGEKNVRDQLIDGCISDKLKKLLLEKGNDLTLEKAISIANSLELVQRQTEIMSEAATTHMAQGRNATKQPQYRRNATSKARFSNGSSSTGAKPKQKATQVKRECYRCGRKSHSPDECWFKDKDCHSCGKRGHIASQCKTRGHIKKKGKDINTISEERHQSESDDETVLMASFGKGPSSPITATMTVNGQSLDFEVDTGATYTVIPENIANNLKNIQLKDTRVDFKSFTGERIKPKGISQVEVEYNGEVYDLNVFVVKETTQLLLGRDWLAKIRLDWPKLLKGIHNVQHVTDHHAELNSILKEYESLFDGKLGRLKDVKAKIDLVPDSTPYMAKCQRVPYAMREEVNQEIDRLVKEGILTPVEKTDWASSIVTVRKTNGGIRVCGNYKPSVNPHLKPIPPPNINVEDILSSLAGGQKFTTLDLAQAYNQMELETESKKLLTIITEKGLFQPNRLTYGITSAPALWQNTMQKVLTGLEGVMVYLDDIIVTGKDNREHLTNLKKVLTRLEANGLKLRKEKCRFFQESVSYLGRVIDKDGVHKNPTKTDEILNIPLPEGVSELRSYLGMINYYQSFVPNLSSILRPLYAMLEKGKKFEWSDKGKNAFENSKRALAESGFLTH